MMNILRASEEYSAINIPRNKYPPSKKVGLICTHRALKGKTTQKVKIRNKEQNR